MALSNVADLVEDIRQGKMVILMDDEGRENEGDLIIAAEAVTAETINFYSSEACGLICLTITPEQAQRLKLPLMVRDNRSQHETNFTVSIDAADKLGPGISSIQRAPHGAHGGSSRCPPRGHYPAWTYLSTGCQIGGCVAPRRAYRGGLRPGGNGRLFPVCPDR